MGFDTVEILKRLCATAAVSGTEQQGAAVVAELLSPYVDRVEIDPFGNLLGVRKCGLEGAETVLLDAHLDQIGFVVTEVLEGGFLRFQPVGGIDPRMLLGCEVRVLTEPACYGVIASTPPHLQKGGQTAAQTQDMLIDVGFKDAKNRVPVGTPVVFAEEIYQLSADSVTGKCLDDRAGVAALLRAMFRLRDTALKVDVAVLISVQEETTGLGAGIGAYRVQPGYAIAVDVGHAKTPDAPADQTFEYGGGPMVGMGPNLHTGLTRALLRTARAEGIPVQREVMEGNTGTNAWTMQIMGRGMAMGLLSIPLRYMHTPIESVKIADVEAVSELLYHFLRHFDGEVRL